MPSLHAQNYKSAIFSHSSDMIHRKRTFESKESDDPRKRKRNDRCREVEESHHVICIWDIHISLAPNKKKVMPQHAP
jgi:hypothetical protein